MALSNYSELLSSVALWLNRPDLTTVLPDCVALCEADMNKRLRTAKNENMNTSFSVTGRYTTLPTDFVEMRRVVMLYGSERIELLPLPQASRVSISGEPIYYNIVDDSLEVVPLSTAYSLELTYWTKVPALVSASVNGVLTSVPDVYLYGTCAQAGYFLDDSQMVARFEPKYEQAVRAANSTRFRQLGSGLTVRAS